jgi:antitoxin component YwqK of YwqJK toxin-antitoxin module
VRPAGKSSLGGKIAMKKMSWLVAVLVVAAGCGVTQAGTAQSRPVTHRNKLKQDSEIQGTPCAKGYAWFYADGKLENCAVSKEFVFGEAKLPMGSILALEWTGAPKYAMMQHDAEVAGVKCSGGNWLLGPSEGAMTVFYPSGKLKLCYLAGDQVVQGVPCMRGGFLGLFGDGARRDGGAKFYESGKLESCTLAREYGGKRRGERFMQAQ